MFFFFFNDTATTEIYTLSLHDALPIFHPHTLRHGVVPQRAPHFLSGGRGGTGRPLARMAARGLLTQDRKSTRLNSSHANISYAVFCLKKKTILTTSRPYFLHILLSLPF